MNEFIDMRRSYFDSKGDESFVEYYLTHRCDISDQDNATRDALRNRIAAIRVLTTTDSIGEEDINRLLTELGDHPYLDRSIVGVLLAHKAQLTSSSVQNILLSMLSATNSNSQRMTHLLDICMECDMPLLHAQCLRESLLCYRRDFDVLSALIEYVRHFSIEMVSDLLFDYLSEAYPENIKLQIIDYLAACNPHKTEISRLIRDKLTSEPNVDIYVAFLAFLSGRRLVRKSGIVVVQTIFYGDPEYSGKGQSGGLGTLLKSLGNQLSKQQQISHVITLAINQDWHDQKRFFQQYNDKHWLIRLPVYLNIEDPHAFTKRELAIKRTVARFFSSWQVKPDIFHLRYLDNASKAIALLSKEMHAKLVFTLTPDPHRNMTDADGNFVCFKVEDTLEKLNKITIGDELLSMADGVVGIGGEAVRRELQLYFPQLNQRIDQYVFRMIGEGIDTYIDMQFFDLWQFLDQHALSFRIDPSNRAKPVILNVGRLSRQKGQHHLLQAWGESQLWHDFNLVIIGGSRASEAEEEHAMKAYFETYMVSKPYLSGKFAHAEALPNSNIRMIERIIMEGATQKYPHIYLCSSEKEEFGISILEALSEGFLVFAPIKGGVKTYIVNGINGFLVDTSNASSLMGDVETVLYHSHMCLEDFAKIQQNGKRTVLDHFSMEEIAKQFLAMYIGLSEERRVFTLDR